MFKGFDHYHGSRVICFIPVASCSVQKFDTNVPTKLSIVITMVKDRTELVRTSYVSEDSRLPHHFCHFSVFSRLSSFSSFLVDFYFNPVFPSYSLLPLFFCMVSNYNISYSTFRDPFNDICFSCILLIVFSYLVLFFNNGYS